MLLIPHFDVSEMIGKAVIQQGKILLYFRTQLLYIQVKKVSKSLECPNLPKKLGLKESGTS